MSSDRLKALNSMSATELDVIFIDKDELCSWEIKNSPFHPAYKYLSPIDRGDYLKCFRQGRPRQVFIRYVNGAITHNVLFQGLHVASSFATVQNGFVSIW